MIYTHLWRWYVSVCVCVCCKHCDIMLWLLITENCYHCHCFIHSRNSVIYFISNAKRWTCYAFPFHCIAVFVAFLLSVCILTRVVFWINYQNRVNKLCVLHTPFWMKCRFSCAVPSDAFIFSILNAFEYQFFLEQQMNGSSTVQNEHWNFIIQQSIQLQYHGIFKSLCMTVEIRMAWRRDIVMILTWPSIHSIQW